jgi:hypothetical protein
MAAWTQATAVSIAAARMRLRGEQLRVSIVIMSNGRILAPDRRWDSAPLRCELHLKIVQQQSVI